VYFGKPGSAAVDYVRALSGSSGVMLTQQQLDSSSAWCHNAAEWLVDVFTQADREGHGGAFADAYEASKLKQVCAYLRYACNTCRCLSNLAAQR
jgi:hypothetical protein